MSKLVVWVATNAFLYLPIYAIRDLGVLSRVASSLGQHNLDIEIRTPKHADGGDENAIQSMLRAAEDDASNSEIVHLAIADPIPVAKLDPAGRTVKLLGAFIKRPPFWVVGRQSPHVTDHIVITYDQNYATGNALGTAYAALHNYSKFKYVELGQEIDLLFSGDKPEGTFRVVTADVIGLVRAQAQDNSIKIIDRLARTHAEFVTTGIITWSYKRNSEQILLLSVFMEALRTSCILLHTAERPSASLIEQLSQLPEFSSQLQVGGKSGTPGLKPEEAKQVARLLFEDGIYDNSLVVRQSEWLKAVAHRAWKKGDENHERDARRVFRKAYDSRPGRLNLETWLKAAMPAYANIAEHRRSAENLLIATLGPIFTLFASVMVMSTFGAEDRPPMSVPWFYEIGATAAFMCSLFFVLRPFGERLAEILNLPKLLGHADDGAMAELRAAIVPLAVSLLVMLAWPNAGGEKVEKFLPPILLLGYVLLSIIRKAFRD